MAVEAAAGEMEGRLPLVPVSVHERRLDSSMEVFCHGSRAKFTDLNITHSRLILTFYI
jgi:hypothetical protein